MCKLQKQKVKFILMLIAYVIDAAFITLNVVTMQEINSIHLSYLYSQDMFQVVITQESVVIVEWSILNDDGQWRQNASSP